MADSVVQQDKLFFLEIVTPEKTFFRDNVKQVIVATPDGRRGVLVNHIPMVLSIASDQIKIQKADDSWLSASIGSGFMEITRKNSIILVDSAEWPEEIDINRAREAKMRAEERLHKKLSHREYIQSQAALARALARLKVTKKIN